MERKLWDVGIIANKFFFFFFFGFRYVLKKGTIVIVIVIALHGFFKLCCVLVFRVRVFYVFCGPNFAIS